MKAVIQRVAWARVVVAGEEVGAIGAGILALIGVEPDDTPARAALLLDRLVRYRIFADESGRMNRSLLDTGGELLLVPQFTLAADTHSGTRPSFTPAAAPDEGGRLFEEFVSAARLAHTHVQTGEFGACMKVHLVNDGPVTFWLRVAPAGGS